MLKPQSVLAFAAAAAAAVAALSAGGAAASEVRFYGLVNTGLYYTNPRGADGQLKLAGIGETPWDSSVHLTGREDLGNGRYIGFNLGTTFAADAGAFSNSGVMFDASRLFIGNEDVELSIGRIGGFTVATEPYSLYMRLNANMTGMQLAGIAPANLTYRPQRNTNAVAVATPMGRQGFFAQALYSNGDSNGGVDEEAAYDWSDRLHVFQAGAGWVGERLRWGLAYSWELPSNHTEGAERRKATEAVHLIASYDFGGPALAVVASAGWDMWRLGAAPDLNQMLAQGRAESAAKGNAILNRSRDGLDAQAVIVTGRWPLGPHHFSFSAGYMQGDWKGSREGVKEDDGCVWQCGLAYRYWLSKKTHWYAAASYAEGSGLFSTVARFNQVMATTGLAVAF